MSRKGPYDHTKDSSISNLRTEHHHCCTRNRYCMHRRWLHCRQPRPGTKPVKTPVVAKPVVVTKPIKTETHAEAPRAVPIAGCDQYTNLLSKYPWDVRIARAVMQAESSCRSDAVGDDYPINGVHAPSCGLMQVRVISSWRGTCEQLKDPEHNISIAYQIYKNAGGFTPWSAFNSGAYLKYM